MGIGVCPVFHPQVAGADFGADGKIVLHEMEVLDELAAEVGVLFLSAFADNRSIPDDFDGDPDELEDLMGPWNEWFDVDEGIETTVALIDAISGGHEVIDEFEFPPESVVEELQELLRCLRLAKTAGARFRLEVF